MALPPVDVLLAGDHPVRGLAARDLTPARPPLRLTGPGVVLGGVLAVWVLVPDTVVRPKVGVALLLLCVAWVWGAICRNARGLRWSATAVLVLLAGTCGILSTPWYGSLGDLFSGLGGSALLVGCMLLAAHCDAIEARRLITVVLVLGVAEAACAAASTFLGVPAPWGYLGAHGSVFQVNELLTALPGRATGTMGHPIPFGTLEATCAVLALYAARHWSMWVRAACFVACAAGVVLSGSRSAAFVLLGAAVVGALWPRAFRTGFVPRLLLMVGVVVVLASVNLSEVTAVSSLSGTGSVTHRVAALQSIGRLVGRPGAQVLFGSGQGSVDSLFAQGFLQQDGFFAVDDQWVTTFAVAGAVGLAALVAAVLFGLVQGTGPTRPAVLVPVLMFLSFDLLEWRATAVLFGVLIALGTGRARASADPGLIEPSGRETAR